MVDAWGGDATEGGARGVKGGGKGLAEGDVRGVCSFVVFAEDKSGGKDADRFL